MRSSLRPIIHGLSRQQRQHVIHILILHHAEYDTQETVVRLRGVIESGAIIVELTERINVCSDAMRIMAGIANNQRLLGERLPSSAQTGKGHEMRKSAGDRILV